MLRAMFDLGSLILLAIWSVVLTVLAEFKFMAVKYAKLWLLMVPLGTLSCAVVYLVIPAAQVELGFPIAFGLAAIAALAIYKKMGLRFMSEIGPIRKKYTKV